MPWRPSLPEHGIYDLVTAIPQGVVGLPWAQHAGLVNRPAAALLGVPAGEIAKPELTAALTRLAARAADPDGVEELLSPSGPAAQPPRELTVQLRDPGTSLRITVVPASDGQMDGGILLNDDITREEASERRLRLAAEKKHAQLAENLEVAIDAARLGPWSWYPVEGRLVWSDACKALFGIPASEEVDYARFIGSLHPDDRERVQAGVERAISGGGDFDQEYRVIWPDGSEHWVNSLARVFYQPDGSLERFEGVAQDITARRESKQRVRDHVEALAQSKREIEALNQELVRRAREAETAVRARTAFMRNVSHEFRTPLNHILGGVELLLADATLRQETWLCRIRDAARALNRLVDGVLDLASLSAGGVTLESKPLSLSGIAREMLSLYSPQATAKSLSMSLRLDPHLPDVVLGDAARISQLVGVYLGNAVKFTEHGSIELEFALQSISDDAVVLRCSVSDTGPGIDADVRDRIFDAFEQGDASLSRRHGGIGLGLSSVGSIVALLGGKAGVESTPGSGSRFWFTARLALSGDADMPRPAAMPHIVPVPPMPSTPVAPDLRADVLAILGDIDDLLSGDDMRAASVLRANADLLRRALGKEPLESLSAAADTFDFSAARTLVARLRENLREG